MNINEFRKNYPDYKDWSDEEIAGALHKKYYPEMDPGEFNKRFLGSSLDRSIWEASRTYGIPEDRLRAVAKVESSGKQSAVSPKGATGVMQIMPGTAKGIAKVLGVTPDQVMHDQHWNIMGGAYYLRQMYDKTGSWDDAHMAYNAGPGRWQRTKERFEDYLNHMPRETQDYIVKINEEIQNPLSALDQTSPVISASEKKKQQQYPKLSARKPGEDSGRRSYDQYLGDLVQGGIDVRPEFTTPEWIGTGLGATLAPANLLGMGAFTGLSIPSLLLGMGLTGAVEKGVEKGSEALIPSLGEELKVPGFTGMPGFDETPEATIDTGLKKSSVLGALAGFGAIPWTFEAGPALRKMYVPTAEELATRAAPKLADLTKWQILKRQVAETPHRMEIGTERPQIPSLAPAETPATKVAKKGAKGMTIAQARKWVTENQPETDFANLPKSALAQFPDDVQKALSRSKKIKIVEDVVPEAAPETPVPETPVPETPTGPVKVGVRTKGNLIDEFYIEPHPDGGYRFTQKIYKEGNLKNTATIATGDMNIVKQRMDENFAYSQAEKMWQPVEKVPTMEMEPVSARAQSFLDELMTEERFSEIKSRKGIKTKGGVEAYGWTRGGLIEHMSRTNGQVPEELVYRRPDWMTPEQWERLKQVAIANQELISAQRKLETARPQLKSGDMIGNGTLSQYWDLVVRGEWSAVRREVGLARGRLGDTVVSDELTSAGKALEVLKERTGLSLRSKKLKARWDDFTKEITKPYQTGQIPLMEPEEAAVEAFAPTAVSRAVSGEGGTELVGRKDLVDYLRQKLNTPIRTGLRGRGSRLRLGEYHVWPEVARTKYANDPQTSYHEVAHHLQKYLFPGSTTPKGGLSQAPFAAYRDELQKLAYPGAKKKSVEGFAEFVRMYVTSPETVAKEAPRFLEHFEGLLKSKAPEVREILMASRSMYEQYLKLSPLQRTMSLIGSKTQKVRSITLNKLYQWAFEDIHPLSRLVYELGDPKWADENPYKLARLLPGSSGRAETFLFHKTMDFKTLEWKGAGLKEALSGLSPKEIKEFEAYCLDKSAVELWQKRIDCGIPLDQAKAGIAACGKRYEEAHTKLMQFQRDILEYLKDGGVISDKHFKNLLNYRKFYIPMYRILDMEEQALGYGAGGRGLEAYNPIKRMKGSWLNFKNPLESVIRNTFRFVQMADRNSALLTFVDFARKFEGHGKVIEKVSPKVYPVQVSFDETMKALANEMGVPKSLLKEFMGDFKVTFTIFRPSMTNREGNVVRVLRNGKPEHYLIADPELAAVIKGLHKDEMSLTHKFIKLASLPTRVLRAGAILDPSFMARNITRDPMVAYIQSKYGFTPGIDSAKGVFALIDKSDWYWKWKASGADMATFTSLDKTSLGKTAEELMANPTVAKAFANSVKHPIELLRYFTEFSEHATRVGVFRRAMEALEKEGIKGRRAILEAGYESREATLDFYRAGTVGSLINRFVAFWNANMQGVDKMVRTFKANPTSTGYKVLSRITMPSILLTAAQWDNPVYKQIPRWERDLFWCIVFGRDPKTAVIARIPKPFEFGVMFGSMPERVTEWVLDRDPHAFDSVLETFSRSFNPFAWPTVIGPTLEASHNYSYFTGKPIMSEGAEKLLPGYQSNPYTRQVLQDLGEVIGVSPAKMEHVLRGHTGGLGMLVIRGLDNMYKQMAPPQAAEAGWSLKDIPVIGGFVSRHPTTAARDITLFYNNLDRAVSLQRTFNDLKDKGQREKATKLIKEAREDYGLTMSWNNPGKMSLGIMNIYQQRMSRLWKQLKRIRYDQFMTSDQKRAEMDEIVIRMTDNAQNANDKIDERKGHHRHITSIGRDVEDIKRFLWGD